ncbi:MAG: 5'/3'-nucleotidase SurE [Crocinitomicaceae bacterium]|nr:5'/3'-nucleotidase SurE [Crocinitomicaceae bacterium]
MSPKRPLILITNDDGISSKGIKALLEAVKEFGDIVVVAPDSAQSGMGHAITINEPLRLSPSRLFDEVTAYSCSGTPVDCVKLGVYEVLHRKPDLVLSGINHGANTSSNVLYSGTMSAAVEAAMEGIPSVGFSLCNFDSDADFSASISVVKNVVSQVLVHEMMARTCLNVNIPDVSIGDLKEIKICRQAHAFWEDRFDKREDQFGKPYYWLTGEFLEQDKAEDTDLYWIDKGHPTIVPTQFDMTSYKSIKELENWDL